MQVVLVVVVVVVVDDFTIGSPAASTASILSSEQPILSHEQASKQTSEGCSDEMSRNTKLVHKSSAAPWEGDVEVRHDSAGHVRVHHQVILHLLSQLAVLRIRTAAANRSNGCAHRSHVIVELRHQQREYQQQRQQRH
jgi:hypothetical protein